MQMLGNLNLYPSGLIINPKCPWLGCTPDRKVFDISAREQGLNPIGLLEIKVPKEGLVDFSNVIYINTDPITNELTLKRNHDYYYQIQCQLALTGIQWCAFFYYINKTTFSCERTYFAKDCFQIAKDKVDQFFFDFYLDN